MSDTTSDSKETPYKRLKHGANSIIPVNSFECGECSFTNDDTNHITVQNDMVFENYLLPVEDVTNDNQIFDVCKNHDSINNMDTESVSTFMLSESNQHHQSLDHLLKYKTDHSHKTSNNYTNKQTDDNQQPGCSVKRERGNGLIRHIIEDSVTEERLCFENILQNGSHSPVVSENDRQDTIITDSSEDMFNKYLFLWQNRQMGRSFADNTINTLLNDLGSRSVDDRFRVQEFSENIETYNSDSGDNASDDGVEDEAIRMAINTHGLHNKSSKDMYSCVPTNCTCTYSRSISSFPYRESQTIYKPFHSRNDLPKCTTYYNVQESSIDSENGINELNISISPVCSVACDSQAGTPSLSVRMEEELLPETNLPDHTDFMDKAVNFAIQEKGLSTMKFNKHL